MCVYIYIYIFYIYKSLNLICGCFFIDQRHLISDSSHLSSCYSSDSHMTAEGHQWPELAQAKTFDLVKGLNFATPPECIQVVDLISNP